MIECGCGTRYDKGNQGLWEFHDCPSHRRNGKGGIDIRGAIISHEIELHLPPYSSVTNCVINSTSIIEDDKIWDARNPLP